MIRRPVCPNHRRSCWVSSESRRSFLFLGREGSQPDDGVTSTINNQFVGVEIALLGDPTLRFQITAPPSNLTSATAGGAVSLAWLPSPEAASQYFVYRSTNGVSGDFVRLTSQSLASASYTDSPAPSGQKTYEVRALKGVTTGSGSFTNVSSGIFTTLN